MIKTLAPDYDVSTKTRNCRPIARLLNDALIPLRTEAEVNVRCELVEALVVKISAKCTATVLRSAHTRDLDLIRI